MEKTTRFRLGVAAAALAGAAFGGVALGPVLAGAQESDDTTTTVPQDDGSDTGTDQAPAPEDCDPGGGGPRGRFGGPGLDAAAEAIGIEADALRDALADGQTIAEVAEANGVDVQTVIDALVAEAQEHLAEAVADGRLTQEEADERSADLEERITDRVNGELPAGGPGFGGRGGPGFGGPRGERPSDAPADDGAES